MDRRPRCIRCGSRRQGCHLPELPLCDACAFELQSRAIDEAIDDGIIRFSHNDHDGQAVYTSLIFPEPVPPLPRR